MMLSISKRCILILIVCLALIFKGSNAFAATITRFVDASVSTSGNGESWVNAKKYLQDGLTLADAWHVNNPSDTVDLWVANGTYRTDESDADTDGSDDRNATFGLRKQVKLFGGFAGGETQLSARNPAMNVAILTGEIYQAGTSDNSYHVVSASDVDMTDLNTELASRSATA